jgi:putative oligomerization/nucleic acid binding protein
MFLMEHDTSRIPGGAQAPETSPSLQAALESLWSLLVEGERLEAWAVQHRLFALTHRRILVGATTGRLIVLDRRLLSGFAPVDIRWQDLRDARLSVGLFGADLTVTVVRGGDLAGTDQGTQTITITGLRKDQATTVYRLCQSQEQGWREKRRIRDLEELRAKSGGVTIGPAAGVAVGLAGEPQNGNPSARLQRAKEMLAQGLITDSEYESIKAKIVSGL